MYLANFNINMIWSNLNSFYNLNIIHVCLAHLYNERNNR